TPIVRTRSGAWSVVNSLAVPNTSSNALKPLSNTPSRIRMSMRMVAEMISTMSILPMVPDRRGAYVSCRPLSGHFQRRYAMTVHKALLARLEAKPGKEAAVQDLLTKAVELANQEQRTTVWFALRLGPSTFGVFDAFADEAGRQAHLNGPI